MKNIDKIKEMDSWELSELLEGPCERYCDSTENCPFTENRECRQAIYEWLEKDVETKFQWKTFAWIVFVILLSMTIIGFTADRYDTSQWEIIAITLATCFTKDAISLVKQIKK